MGIKDLENSLAANIKNFVASARLVYKSEDYTSATVLYFKTLFCTLDLIILKEKGFIPKDHSERFRVLEKDFPDFYTFIDKYFPIYQSSYSQIVTQEVCDKIKEYVEGIIEKQGIY